MGSYIFQEYKRGAGARKGSTTEPTITITRGGLFSINRAAYDMLERPDYVALLYDRRNRAIAFKKAGKDDDNAYPVRKQGNSASYLVSGKAFLQFIGEKFGDELIRLAPHKEEEVIVMDLPGGEPKESPLHESASNEDGKDPASLLDERRDF